MYLLLLLIKLSFAAPQSNLPLIIATWEFSEPVDKGWEVLHNSGSLLDAVEEGCALAEADLSIINVGIGGRPDENGETSQDAMIMDGSNYNIGAVGGLRRIKHAVKVARAVMNYTTHTLLVGDLATEFAVSMGFTEESLESENATKLYNQWLNDSCQPNFWQNVTPDPETSCGPYSPAMETAKRSTVKLDINNHDTIGIIAVNTDTQVAAAVSTNGLNFKIPGRVGDSPIPGAGCYADSDVGVAAATGNGDIMIRFLPSLVTVEGMRRGLSPSEAADFALDRIVPFFPNFQGAVIAASNNGSYGAACKGYVTFPFTVRSQLTGSSVYKRIICKNN